MRRHPVLSRTGPTLAGYAAGAAVAGVIAAATYLLAGGAGASGAPAPAGDSRAHERAQTSPMAAHAPSVPTPLQFGIILVTSGNAYALAHHDARRLSAPHCVPGHPGHYMCVYLLTRPHRPRECHLVQAEWTPERASTFTITLGGRVRRCGSVRQAIHSL